MHGPTCIFWADLTAFSLKMSFAEMLSRFGEACKANDIPEIEEGAPFPPFPPQPPAATLCQTRGVGGEVGGGWAAGLMWEVIERFGVRPPACPRSLCVAPRSQVLDPHAGGGERRRGGDRRANR